MSKYGQLAKQLCGGVRLENQILQSAAGYYIGTYDAEGPVSRESLEYWPTRKLAEEAYVTGNWTQRDHP